MYEHATKNQGHFIDVSNGCLTLLCSLPCIHSLFTFALFTVLQVLARNYENTFKSGSLPNLTTAESQVIKFSQQEEDYREFHKRNQYFETASKKFRGTMFTHLNTVATFSLASKSM